MRPPSVRAIQVFGPMARDDADASSAVDLLVETAPDTAGFVPGALSMDAQDLLGRRVDVVTEKSLHPLVRDRILDEAQPL